MNFKWNCHPSCTRCIIIQIPLRDTWIEEWKLHLCRGGADNNPLLRSHQFLLGKNIKIRLHKIWLSKAPRAWTWSWQPAGSFSNFLGKPIKTRPRDSNTLAVVLYTNCQKPNTARQGGYYKPASNAIQVCVPVNNEPDNCHHSWRMHL
jgi:hypothetical protein